MPASKIQDEAEVLGWFDEGRTYQWMVEEYLRKYNIQTSPSLWGMFRRRHGIPRRIVRDNELIPWRVNVEHRFGFPIIMLRVEARRRERKELPPHDEGRLDAWLTRLKEDNAVVHYDPDTEEGWFYVPRREGIDTDLIRVPEENTGRPSAD